MSLHLYHNLSGGAIVFFIVCKVVVHYYLDKRHQRNPGLSIWLVSPGYYFRWYRLPVEPGAVIWKQICNACLVLVLVVLVLNFVIGLVIYSSGGYS
ncbi:MAG: hypothetical protein U0Y08_05970 [Bacteroidia bacterium]